MRPFIVGDENERAVGGGDSTDMKVFDWCSTTGYKRTELGTSLMIIAHSEYSEAYVINSGVYTQRLAIASKLHIQYRHVDSLLEAYMKMYYVGGKSYHNAFFETRKNNGGTVEADTMNNLSSYLASVLILVASSDSFALGVVEEALLCEAAVPMLGGDLA